MSQLFILRLPKELVLHELESEARELEDGLIQTPISPLTRTLNLIMTD